MSRQKRRVRRNQSNHLRRRRRALISEHLEVRCLLAGDFGDAPAPYPTLVADNGATDRQLFSIGAAHSFGDGWQLEGGYMYVLLDDNSYRGNRPFDPANGEPNGTSALDGQYEGHVRLFGIGVNKAFM